MKNVDVGPQKGTSERRNFFNDLVNRSRRWLADLRTEYEVNKMIQQEHKLYKAKKKALLRERALLERAHMKLVSLHNDAVRMHEKKDSNVKIIFTGQGENEVKQIENDLSKEDDEDKDKSDRNETNNFLATLLSGFLEASSRHLPSMDPRPPSPKYENFLTYTFYFYFFIIVSHDPNINFLL